MKYKDLAIPSNLHKYIREKFKVEQLCWYTDCPEGSVLCTKCICGHNNLQRLKEYIESPNYLVDQL